jgi:FkbM family methyltransferase
MSPSAQSEMLSSGPEAEIAQGFNRLRMCRSGPLLYNAHDVYVGRSLQAYGEYNQFKLDLLLNLVGRGDVVVDVGAHIGVHTVSLAQAVGKTGAVIAIEPQRLLFQTMCGNAALNGLENVFALHGAAGEKLEQIIVPTLNFEVENNYGAVELGMYTEGEAVPLMPIDNLPLRACRLVAIDVEGMELAVLRGGAKLIQQHRPMLYVANYRKDKSAALISHLMDLGYRLYWSIVPLYNPQNFYGNAANIFDNTVTVGMIGVPPGKSMPVDGKQIASPSELWHGGASVTINSARMMG